MLTGTASGYLEEPLKKPSKLSVKAEVKRQREKDINRMSTGAIVAHLMYRHRVGLLILSNVVLIAYIVKSNLGL